MATYNTDLLPNTSGQNLGSISQMWDAFVRNHTFARLISASVNAAQSGVISLANLDTITWRSADNISDIVLGNSGIPNGNFPADLLAFAGSGFKAAAFVSATTNPSVAGVLRLASSDTINYRNQTNSADIVALKKNADDSLTLGGTAGLSPAGDLSISGNLTVTGSTTTASISGQAANFPVIAKPVSTGTGYDLTLAGGDSTVTSGNVFVRAGNGTGVGVTAGGNAYLRGGTGTVGGNIFIGDTAAGAGAVAIGSSISNSTPVDLFGKIRKYLGISTVANGIPASIAAVDLTAQTAAITTATLFAVVTAGQYRLNWNAKITTAAGTSSTLGALTIVYTDPDGVAVTLTAAAVISAGTVATTSAANTTGTVLLGIPQFLNCKAGTNVTYAFAYASNAANIMAYNLHILLEAM